MHVLGIESSCDETGVALVEADGDATPRLLAQALHSQVEMHADYGGVVPELASRDHIRRVLPLTREVLGAAGADARRDRRRRLHARPGSGRRAAGRRRRRLLARRGARQAGARRPPSRRATCCRRSSRPIRRRFRSSPARFGRPHATARGRRRRRATRCSATPSTTPPARPSTSRPSCSASAIRAGRRWRGWPSSAIPRPIALPRPLLHSAIRSTSRSPA